MCAKWKVIGGEEHRISREHRQECEQRRRNLPAYQAYLAQLKGEQLIQKNRVSQEELDVLLQGVLKKIPPLPEK